MISEKPSLISATGDEDKERARKQKEKSSGLVEKLLASKENGLLTKARWTIAYVCILVDVITTVL